MDVMSARHVIHSSLFALSGASLLNHTPVNFSTPLSSAAWSPYLSRLSLTDSPFQVALLFVLRWAPMFLFALFSGMVADRANRWVVMSVARVTTVAVTATCTSIGFGQTLLGSIDLAGELDCYSFLGDAGDQVRLPRLTLRTDVARTSEPLQQDFGTILDPYWDYIFAFWRFPRSSGIARIIAPKGRGPKIRE